MLSCPRCGVPYASPVEYCGLDGDRLVEVDVDPLIGRTVDRYKIQRRIGDGAMARVYRAEHAFLKHPVAVKILFGEISSNRHFAERFQREAQAAAHIQHANVVSVLDFGISQEGLTFLAMELLDGHTLARVLKGGAFEVRRAMRIADDLASGLASAHGLGYIHRDLKPSNVMVLQRGGRETAKILDFGLVRSFEDRDSTRLTQTGQLFGTPAYMAPEQIGHGEVGPTADLYALGVIMYEMLSGEPPFSGPLSQVLARHLSVPPAPLPPMDGVEAIVDTLLQKEPHLRFQDAESVIAALDRVDAYRTEPPAEPVVDSMVLDSMEAEPIFADPATLSDVPSTMAPIGISVAPPPPAPAIGERTKTNALIAIGLAFLIVVGSTMISMLSDKRAAAISQRPKDGGLRVVAVADPTPIRYRPQQPKAPPMTGPIVLEEVAASEPIETPAAPPAMPPFETAQAAPAPVAASRAKAAASVDRPSDDLDSAVQAIEATVERASKRAKPRPVKTEPPDQDEPPQDPAVARARFQRLARRLDRGIASLLDRRKLHEDDVAALGEPVAERWQAFDAAKAGEDEAVLLDTYDTLKAALSAAQVTPKVISRKLAGVLEQLKGVDPGAQDASFRSHEAKWIELQDRARTAQGPGELQRVLAEVHDLGRAFARTHGD